MANSKDKLKALNSSTSASASTIAERPAHLWKPGQSGNPKGRPKSYREAIRELIGDHGEKAFALLWETAQGLPATIPGTITPDNAVQLDRVPSLELMHKARVCLIEYLLGKPPDRVELSGPEGAPVQTINFDRLSTEEVRALIAMKQRLLDEENK